MIGKIKGILNEIIGNEIYLQTASGVFYKAYATNFLLTQSIGTDLTVYTYHQVREDAQVLFAFENYLKYQSFTLLLNVSGVGPKTAFTVTSQLEPGELLNIITRQDVDSLCKVPGLGKKTAQKIILELAGKFKLGVDLGQLTQETKPDDEAVLALRSLGYNLKDATEMLKKIEPTLPTAEKVKLALKKG